MSVCRSCGAEIRFVRTAAGKSMPLDVDPVEGGEWAVSGGKLRGKARPGETGYRAHWVTCVSADQHRKAK